MPRRYLVPKFIEKEPKIVGPMTFKQFSYIGVAGIISVILYFSLPLIYFILFAVILFGAAIALAFITVGGKSLPSVLWDSISFLFSPKIYLWKKKKSTPRIIERRKREKKPQKTEQPKLSITQKSRLKEMETRVKTTK